MQEKIDASFQKALIENDLTKATRLIAKGPNVNCELQVDNLIDDRIDYVTPLAIAIENLDYPLTKLLLEAGADPNYPLPLNMGLVEFLLRILIDI